ncbi:MAG TPA: tetratricopeptide repeat protein, partial [Kofleriaceae bacterium]|nr:tetratricopeptide repeat protein [Kofleriaceae bacterium]
DELVKVVARRAELTEDAGVRLVLLHRVAALYEEALTDPASAITAYRNVLGVDDTDLEALDALERLYRSTGGDPRELVQTIERKIELITDPPARRELRLAAAQVHEQQLSDIYQAIGQLTAILDEDLADPAALAELDRIYTGEKMWTELLEVVDRRANLAASAQHRADLMFRAGSLVERELSDPDGAIPRYGAVLGVLPAHAAARDALEALMARDAHVEPVAAILERVYRTDRDAAGLIRVYERRLAVGVGDRRADWESLADVHETLAGAPAEAFAVWSRAIEAAPDDVELLQPLLRLAQGQGLWRELAARLDQLLGEALPPDVEQAYAMQLGEIARDRLADVDRAVAAFERAANGPDPRPALGALELVLGRAGRWPELAVVLRRQADAAEDDAATAAHLHKLGELAEATLGDARAAIAAYREVLGIDAAHAGARAALERMLRASADGARHLETVEILEIVEILEPLFEQDGDDARLALAIEARFRATPDPIDRAGILQHLVELYEQRLFDRARALDAALRWLTADPTSSQALHDVERLPATPAEWTEVAERASAIARAPEAGSREPEAQIALLVFLGKVQRERLGQLDEAAASYRAALALDPAAIAALDDLVEILRERGDHAALAEALLQRGRAVTELPEKRAAFAEVARILERTGDRAGAIAAWREVVDADDGDREALGELARIYRTGGQPAEVPELIETLAHAARVAASPDEEKPLRVEIAQLEEGGPRAVAAWQAVLDLDPDDLAALGSLEGAYGRAGDWMAVSDIQTRRLQLARTPAEKVAIHAEMARTAEQQRGAADDAVASWYAALDVDGTYRPAYAELERLLGGAGRWHDLVDLLVERLAELEASRGDHRAELDALARAADIWESRLDNPDAAGELLERILQREPGSVAALTRLSKIYERAGDWEKCTATLNEALRLSPTGRDAADL